MRQQNSGVLLPGTKGVERVVGGNKQLSHTVPAELGCCLIKGFLSPWMGWGEGGSITHVLAQKQGKGRDWQDQTGLLELLSPPSM